MFRIVTWSLVNAAYFEETENGHSKCFTTVSKKEVNISPGWTVLIIYLVLTRCRTIYISV